MPTVHTAADLRSLATFRDALDALDWREGVERHAACRRGSRLCELGWLQLVRPAMRSTGGFMAGRYFPAEYKLTPAGVAASSEAPVTFEMNGRAYRTDAETLDLLRGLVPAAKAANDMSAVALVMELGQAGGRIVQLPS